VTATGLGIERRGQSTALCVAFSQYTRGVPWWSLRWQNKPRLRHLLGALRLSPLRLGEGGHWYPSSLAWCWGRTEVTDYTRGVLHRLVLRQGINRLWLHVLHHKMRHGTAFGGVNSRAPSCVPLHCNFSCIAVLLVSFFSLLHFANEMRRRKRAAFTLWRGLSQCPP
jgi:hypothetical protein